MNRPQRLTDLLAFVAVLLTVVGLLLIGVPTESLAIVVVAMGGLYGTWVGTVHRPRSGSRTEADDEER
ncbi:hypothetical protein ACIF80_04740 [Streptomyces sp. NPDC085927]|uniref:hypothetical protein n=1 Tax=Streptomyces sp. NPDC085927 TaxID=3365738 RepID=UPI0037D02447